MENLVVGQRVILNREMLGEHVGSIGFVYEVYQDFDYSSFSNINSQFYKDKYEKIYWRN